MDNVELKVTKQLKSKNAILIEGLPGIGLVGKLAADHLLDELGAKKIAEIYSPYLPPQVAINKDGVVDLVKINFYHHPLKKHDIILMIGDFQGITPDSQYQISERIIDYAQNNAVKRIYTLGGLGTGVITKTPRVFGAATNPKLVKELKKYGLIFKGGGAIFGASGLLLGLGKLRGMEAACLMGETHGQIIDARSAEAVLDVLTKILDIKVNMTKLEVKAKETEQQMVKISKMISMHEQIQKQQQDISNESPSYIR